MNYRDEQDMLEKLAESANKIDIPEALHPQQMETKLNECCKKKRRWYKAAAAAACLCICFGAGSYVFDNASRSGSEQEIYMQATEQREIANEILSNDSEEADVHERAGQKESVKEKKKEVPLKNIGKMYTLAENYEDVYNVLSKSGYYKMRYGAVRETEKQAADEDTAYAESAGSSAGLYNSVSADKDYSSTNLQVEGVDESDIVKTDGRYLYIVQEDKVQVLDVQNKIPKEAGVIVPDLQSDAGEICEMYVADNTLTLIIQTEETSMQQDKVQDDVQKLEDCEDVYRIDTASSTKIETYDITDPKKAVLKDTVTQDGWYQTSRKIGGRLYLFTNPSFQLQQDMMRREEGSEDTAGEWIPSVNGQAVKADCIYLPRSGSDGLLASSIDLEDHNRVVDTKLMIHEYAQLYVTRNSVYLYYVDYAGDVEKTRIARFALDADGLIRAKAAATVKGGIQDTFAIHERDGYLQVLTSVTSTELWENRVYVLDKNMQITGKLTGLAKGEQIYSARFAGTTGYFVTYRNTDPLFTVDFSDPKNPKVIGELEVTGFSEYLHFWSDDLLLGIGYETNPENGEQIGVKLSMFDISDPVRVKEKGRIVLEGTDNCDGMYDYKAVLVSCEKNIIALTTESYQPDYRKDYRVFSYADGNFTSRLECTLARNDHYDANNWRSIYVGEVLYLAGQDRTAAFDMQDGWKKIGRVKY